MRNTRQAHNGSFKKLQCLCPAGCICSWAGATWTTKKGWMHCFLFFIISWCSHTKCQRITVQHNHRTRKQKQTEWLQRNQSHTELWQQTQAHSVSPPSHQRPTVVQNVKTLIYSALLHTLATSMFSWHYHLLFSWNVQTEIDRAGLFGAFFHTGSYFMWRWMTVYPTQTPRGQRKICFTASTSCTCYPLQFDDRESETHTHRPWGWNREYVRLCWFRLFNTHYWSWGKSPEASPLKTQPSVSGWEVTGQSCGNVPGPGWQRAWHPLSSLSGFYLVRFTGDWSQHHAGWWRVKPVL